VMTRPGRRGWADYARLLQAVVEAPCTATELSTRFRCSADNTRRTLRVMRDYGLICELAHRYRGLNSNFVEVVWGFNGPPMPRNAMAPGEPSPNIEAFCKIVSLLMFRGGTQHDLCAYATVHRTRLLPLLGVMRELNLIFVRFWPRPGRTGGPQMPHWAWGLNCCDAARPPATSDATSHRRNRLRRRLRQERLERLHQAAAPLFIFAGRKQPALTQGQEPESEP
jgi:hypothetical protein